MKTTTKASENLFFFQSKDMLDGSALRGARLSGGQRGLRKRLGGSWPGPRWYIWALEIIGGISNALVGVPWSSV